MANRKRGKARKGAAVVVFLLIVLIVAAAAVGFMWRADYVGDQSDTNAVVVEVPAGSSTSAIAALLQEHGIIRHPLFFRLSSRMGGHDGAFLEGTYSLRPSMGYEIIFETLEGKRENESLTRVTIPEGYELRQIAARIAETGLVSEDAFLDAANNHTFDYAFLSDLPDRDNRLEGYLFPDTYFFYEGMSADDIINAMLKRFDEVYTDEYEARARELQMTTDQVVTLASIIEREAVGDKDRKDVSSVFHNRLASSEYPYLQSCATVQYILQERKPVLSESDTRIQSPYNTYINEGLPIGPIASPGKASLEAALYPNQTDYLFFVLGADGKHVFTTNYADHQAAMAQ